MLPLMLEIFCLSSIRRLAASWIGCWKDFRKDKEETGIEQKKRKRKKHPGPQGTNAALMLLLGNTDRAMQSFHGINNSQLSANVCLPELLNQWFYIIILG